MSNAVSSNKKRRSVDALLTSRGKLLKPGESVRFRLIKGPAGTLTADPVDAKAPPETFPLIAKFPESVVKPNFHSKQWTDGRLYQQDTPKPTEDSDEEGGGGAGDEPKKRWKYNRRKQDAPRRQWILQEQVDFLETMVARRQRARKNPASESHAKLSSRYEGLPEHNPSHYMLLMPTTAAAAAAGGSKNTNGDDSNNSMLTVRMLPTPQGTISFAQPAARRTLTLTQAEQAIHDQRAGLSMNLRAPDNDPKAKGKPPAPVNNNGPVRPVRPLQLPGSNKANSSKSRLMNRLKAVAKNAAAAGGANAEEEEGEDVMSDVTFRSRKGAGAARKELFTSLGDGVQVSDDGVLGGTNDAAFGGRQRFGQFKADATKAQGPVEKQERGADGAAMSEDFYQRDVTAEYEELDYDANEQFDDDDVDLGESEVVVESGAGFAAEGQDEDEELEEADNAGQTVSGAEGLASVAGFKAMLAKARGEGGQAPGGGGTPGGGADGTDPSAAMMGADGKIKEGDKNGTVSPKNSTPAGKKHQQDARGGKSAAAEDDHMAKILAAADSAKKKAQARQQQHNNNNNAGPAAADDAAQQQPQAAEQPSPASSAAAAAAGAGAAAEDSVIHQVDENGDRVISLDAVRREIWLNHGSIPMKRLMKIFDVKKKSKANRQDRFRQVVKELCIMKTDPIGGRMLVLKQHYSNMG